MVYNLEAKYHFIYVKIDNAFCSLKQKKTLNLYDIFRLFCPFFKTDNSIKPGDSPEYDEVVGPDLTTKLGLEISDFRCQKKK